MLTGYNSDLLHRGLVLHIQTEDKGESNPSFESVIYLGGQVVAVRRTSYAQQLAAGARREELAAAMDSHHNEVIESIRRGLIDDRLPGLETAEAETDEAGPVEEASAQTAADVEAAAQRRALDQLVADVLADTDGTRERLELSPREPLQPVQGAPLHARLRLRLSSGRPAAGVAVAAQLISTVARPRLLAEGRSDADGHVELEFQVPRLERGLAALIITAESDELGTAELKQLL